MLLTVEAMSNAPDLLFGYLAVLNSIYTSCRCEGASCAARSHGCKLRMAAGKGRAVVLLQAMPQLHLRVLP